MRIHLTELVFRESFIIRKSKRGSKAGVQAGIWGEYNGSLDKMLSASSFRASSTMLKYPNITN